MISERSGTKHALRLVSDTAALLFSSIRVTHLREPQKLKFSERLDRISPDRSCSHLNLKETVMKTHVLSISIFTLLTFTVLPHLSFAQQTKDQTKNKIGIYDSRAVAVSYVGSTFHETKMKELMNQFKKAQQAGDKKEVSRLEAEGQALQKELHQQGFGTAPVDDILSHIAADLSKIQQSAGVTSLISKWNTAELGKHPKAEQVDVTMLLVDAFHPNEKQRKHAIEIQRKAPVRVKE